MNQKHNAKHLDELKKRYQSADKIQKGVILGEFCATWGYNRKYAIRLLNKKKTRRKTVAKPRPGRPRYKKDLLLFHLKAIWIATDFMCSKKLKAALPE